MEFKVFTGAAEEWDSHIACLPCAHVLQTFEWGQVKSHFGWQPYPILWENHCGETVAAALALLRSISIPGLSRWLKVMYIPKGPLLDWNDQPLRLSVLNSLALLARKQGAIFLKIDPDVRLGEGIPGEISAQDDPLGKTVLFELSQTGWHFSDEQIQFRNTVMLDLRPDLDVLLAAMKQKTRYNIRLAERKGVTVRVGGAADIDLLFRLYSETADRDGFVIRDEAYYRWLWSTFFSVGKAEPLIAEVEGQPVAAIVVFKFAGRAWYMNGMSRPVHREKMPGHLLQWAAIQRLKQDQIHTYDLWGAPDVFDDTDTMWGVYRFKEGFGGQVVRHIGAYDLPLRPLMYRFYIRLLPRVLDIMRQQGVERTHRLVDAS
jgi:peptidoglycan pentaglycine glycine transferase (the first glycine)